METLKDFRTMQLEAIKDIDKLRQDYRDIGVPTEHDALEKYLFLSLLLSGTKAIKKDGKVTIFINGEERSIKEEQLSTLPQAQKLIKTLPDKLKEENRDIPLKGLGAIPKETEEYQFKEGEDYKYLNTMWMQQVIIKYSEAESYSEENFIITIFPLALKIERMSIPIICVIQHDNTRKCAYSTEERSSIELNVDDFDFRISTRFVNDRLQTTITQANTKYCEIAGSRKITIDKKGEVIPNHFGKLIKVGEENIEIFPITLTNNQQTGLIPFAYKLHTEQGDECGLSDHIRDEAVVAFSGSANNYGIYWNKDEENNDRLIVITT